MNLEAQKPVCFMVGGPDVDARLELMQRLRGEYELSMAGSEISLQDSFRQAGFSYWYYTLDRGANPIRDLQAVFALVRLFRRVRPAIVHTFDTKPGVLARLAARLAGVPVVIGTLSGLGSLYSDNRFRTRLLRRVYEPLQRLSCHASNLTIFQNPDDLVRFTVARIVPKEKTVVIPGSGVDTHALDTQHFSLEQRTHLRASLGLDGNDLVVMMVSRLIRPKGVIEFADAARRLRSKYPGVVFMLVGPDDGESLQALTNSEREQVFKSVKWIGPRKDIPDLLSISDIFVLPTFYREGVPRVLLEAASMGLPLVATRVPGCTEVVENYVNGFLVPPLDVEILAARIETLALDPSLRERFGKASRQRAVDFFDLTAIAEQTGGIYRRLLAENVRGRKADP